MNRYKFKVRSPTGKFIKGAIKAENEIELKNIFLGINYEVVKYKRIRNKKQILEIDQVKDQDLIHFLEKIYMMSETGIVLSESVKIASKATPKKMLKNALEEIAKDIDKGKMMSSSLEEYPKIFPEYFRTMIRIAEISGNLKDVLKHLIDVYNAKLRLKKKFISSLFYPCILVIFSIIVVGVISFFVMPQFVSIFHNMHVEVPLLTKVIIQITNFIRNYGLFVLLFILLGVFGVIMYFKTNRGKYYKAYLQTKLPIIKQITINNLTSQFCRSVKILTESGVTIVASLQTTAQLVGNEYVMDRFNFVLDEVKKGYKISSSLDSINLFPELLIETISIGENTGMLSDSLGSLASIYEEDNESFLTKLSTLIEPLFIVMIAGVVVLIIIAIFIPLMSMLDTVGGF